MWSCLTCVIIFFFIINMKLSNYLQIAAAWKPLVKKLGLWKSIRSIARLYDAGMGMLIFVPIALFSWFPFISTFQTRFMFNQAFSRGLEISLILAGNNPNNSIWWLYWDHICNRRKWSWFRDAMFLKLNLISLYSVIFVSIIKL